MSRTEGSSPLARGLPEETAAFRLARRIIPARAGFTDARAEHPDGCKDHPRSRGVYAAHSLSRWSTCGSSPLARGLHNDPLDSDASRRIIPARAGFTPRQDAARSRPRDHPRSRGVYRQGDAGLGEDVGSSPLARGLRRRQGGDGAVGGIIPARAGVTEDRSLGPKHDRDHPRSRGVYASSGSPEGVPGGSSPLARGLRPPRWPCGGPVRIIPARAGFTFRPGPSECADPDHPRSRGVYAYPKVAP